MSDSQQSRKAGLSGAKAPAEPSAPASEASVYAGVDQRKLPEEERRQLFLDLLMPLYPKALAYAQSISGSLMDGEDLAGDAVLQAYSRFNQLKDLDKFKPWFFRILLNRFRNLRSRSLLRPLTLVAEPASHNYFWEATTRTSSDPAELGYQLTLVKELLAKLKVREREVILLLGPGGFEVDEVARIQGVSKRAVIQCAYRARKKLAKLMPEGAIPFTGGQAAEVNRNE